MVNSEDENNIMVRFWKFCGCSRGGFGSYARWSSGTQYSSFSFGGETDGEDILRVRQDLGGIEIYPHVPFLLVEWWK
eukprot:1317964-Amorphochlora_amoeboformis.AAC.1